MVEFEWDGGNLEHIARHGVEPDEAEEALLSKTRVLLETVRVRGELRYTFIDRLESGGFLVVVMTRRRAAYRVVTARPPASEEVRKWRRARR